MKIRAHHLLCMQGFQGYGYSKNFIQNMQTVIAELVANPDMEIEIVCECDIICSQCPYIKNNRCVMCANAQQRMQKRDNAVLVALDLAPNAKMKIKDIQSLIGKKINTSEITQKLCGTCLWRKKCLWFIKQTKK